MFVTGDGKDATANPDRPALVRLVMTLVISMGVCRCPENHAAFALGGPGIIVIDDVPPTAKQFSASG